jgi:hypothetical protein
MPDTAIDPEPYHVYAARDGVRLPWHSGDNGRAWWQGLGVILDGHMNAAQAAVASRWVSRCPPDALRIHGESFGMPQAPAETDEEYRVRLRQLWHLAEMRGTKQGLVDALTFIGLLTVSVREAISPGWGRHILAADAAKRMHWFNVVIWHPHPFGTDFNFRYGDGTTYGSGALYGPDGDPRWFPLLKQMVRFMKPAHAHCEWIAIVLAGDIKHANLATDGEPFDAASRVAYLPV